MGFGTDQRAQLTTPLNVARPVAASIRSSGLHVLELRHGARLHILDRLGRVAAPKQTMRWLNTPAGQVIRPAHMVNRDQML